MSRIALSVLALAAGAAFSSAHAQNLPLEVTCPSVQYRGPIIIAQCYNPLRQLIPSSIDVRTCPGGIRSVVNAVGVLYCERRGYGYGAPGRYGPGRGYGRPRHYDEDED